MRASARQTLAEGDAALSEKAQKEIEGVVRGACASSRETQDALKAVQKAWASGGGAAALAELEHLRSLTPKERSCATRVRGLEAELAALGCREQLAVQVVSLGARETILQGSPEEAARALTAAAEAPRLSTEERARLLGCASKQPLGMKARERLSEVTKKHHRRHGGALSAATQTSIAQACDRTSAAEVVRRTLRTGMDHDDLELLVGSLGTGREEALCAHRLRAASSELREENCRRVFKTALGLSPQEAASTQELARLVDLRVRKERLQGSSETWRAHRGLPACLQSDGGKVGERLLRDFGGEPILQANVGEKHWRERLAAAVASSERALEMSCSQVAARRADQRDALSRLLQAQEPKELLKARKEAKTLVQEAEFHASHSDDSALQGRDFRACLQALDEAYEARVNNSCVPQALSVLRVSGSEAEMREKIVGSEAPELGPCAEAIAPQVMRWKSWNKDLLAAEAVAPAVLQETLTARKGICRELAKLRAAPTNPTAALALLALCSLPDWNPQLRAWAHGRAPLAAKNWKSVSRANPEAGLKQLREDIRRFFTLKRSVPLLPSLSQSPCAPPPELVYGNAWYELAAVVLGDVEASEARALTADLMAAQRSMMEQALKAAEGAQHLSDQMTAKAWRIYRAQVLGGRAQTYNAKTTSVRRTVYQKLWEAWLQHAAGNPVGALCTAAEKRMQFSPETPEESLDFLRVETLFFLVLFDVNDQLGALGAVKVERRSHWTNLGNVFGRSTPDDPYRLVEACRVAMEQLKVHEKHPTEGLEDPALYFSSQARAKVWNQFKKSFASADARYRLPAPRLYPLIPFA